MAFEEKPPAQTTSGEYLQSLYQLVPTEITAGYLTIYSLLDPLSTNYIDLTDYMLWASLFVLAILNYFLVGVTRNERRQDVRIYMSATFIVWALGVSVDYWSLMLGMPSSVFAVFIVLWAISSLIFMRYSGVVAK